MWCKNFYLLGKAFIRAQFVAVPIGLLLTLMDAISPNRTALTINQTLTIGWTLGTVAATVFLLAAIEA